MEKWREDARTGHIHEPNDVTFELDGLGRQLSELPAGDSPVSEADSVQKIGSHAPDGPVFVDSSGRRSKKLRRAGWAVSLACACYAMAVIAALVGGNSSAPWLRIPGVAEKESADKVVVQPTPTVGATTSATPGATGVTPSPTDANGAVTVRQPSGSGSGGSGGATGKPGTGASSSVRPPNSSAGTGSTAGTGGSTPGPGSSSPSGGDATGGTGTGGAGGTGGTATTGGTGGGTTDPPSEPSPPPAEPTGPVATTPVQDGGRTMAAEGAR